MSDDFPLNFKIDKFKICLVKHYSAKSVVTGFFRYDHPRLSETKLLKVKTDFSVWIGKTKAFKMATVQDMIDVVRSVGIWGYHNPINKKEKEIHYWIGKKANKSQIVEFFAHELVHAAGFSNETTAFKFARIAKYAYEILQEDILNSPDKKIFQKDYRMINLKKVLERKR